jgi:hypothetical protein
MALSKSPVLEEFETALGEMVSMQAVMQAAIGTIAVLPMWARRLRPCSPVAARLPAFHAA